MGRIQRVKNELNVDLLKPLNREELMQNIDETDCFGKDWEPTTKECGFCAVREICGTLCKPARIAKRGKLEKEMGPFLDQVKKLTVEELDTVEEILTSTHEDGEPTTTDEMFEYFKKKMKTKDDTLVILEIRNFIKSRPNLYTQGGVFYSRKVADKK